MKRTEATALTEAGTCTWSCLLASEPVCTCRCRGRYHGEYPRQVYSPQFRLAPPQKPIYRLQFTPGRDVLVPWRIGACVIDRATGKCVRFSRRMEDAA